MMIDEKIEAHLAAIVAAAYPGIDPDQALYFFSEGQFDFRTGYRQAPGGGRNIIGTDNIVATVQIQNTTKLDRYAMISRLYPARVDLGDGYAARRVLLAWRQKDYVASIEMEAVEFQISFTYEVNYATSA